MRFFFDEILLNGIHSRASSQMATSRRNNLLMRNERSRTTPDHVWSEEELAAIEARFAEGMSVQQVVEVVTSRGARLTEATFRKYVQLGLLPRSVRVGRKGKHRGSQGLYPASVIRQIDHVRRLMAQGFTMEEIQKEFLFVRGEIVALGRKLERIYAAIEDALVDGAAEGESGDPLARRALEEARGAGEDLIRRLTDIERRLSLRARMAKAAV
jgi:DNA-binding transcriptional MerR regulator